MELELALLNSSSKRLLIEVRRKNYILEKENENKMKDSLVLFELGLHC